MRHGGGELAERREPLALHELGGEAAVLAAFLAEDSERAAKLADLVLTFDIGRLTVEIAIGHGAHRRRDIRHRLRNAADHEGHSENAEAEEEEREKNR